MLVLFLNYKFRNVSLMTTTVCTRSERYNCRLNIVTSIVLESFEKVPSQLLLEATGSFAEVPEILTKC